MRGILTEKAGLGDRLKQNDAGRWQLKTDRPEESSRPAPTVRDGVYIGEDSRVQGIVIPAHDPHPSIPDAVGTAQLPWAKAQYDDLDAGLWQNRWATQAAWETRASQGPQGPMTGSPVMVEQLATQLQEYLAQGNTEQSLYLRDELLNKLDARAGAAPQAMPEPEPYRRTASDYVMLDQAEYAAADAPHWATASYPAAPFQPAFQPDPYQGAAFPPDPYQTAAFQPRPFQEAPLQAAPAYPGLPGVGTNASLGQAVRGNLPPGGRPTGSAPDAAWETRVAGMLTQQRAQAAGKQAKGGGMAR